MNKFARFIRAPRALATAGALALVSSGAFAQATDPVTQLFAAINLGTVAVAVLGIGIVVIGIAMAFKGVDLSKRAVRKV